MPILFYRLLFLIGLFSTLLGCDSESPITEPPQQLVLESHLPSGSLISKRTMTPDDPIYQRLKDLLETQRSGWKINIVSYVPGSYILRSEKLSINCYENMMVIDMKLNNQFISMKKNIPRLLQTLGLPPVKTNSP